MGHASFASISCWIPSYHCYSVNRFIINFTITSFSAGADSATINVIATNAPSLILFSPFSL